MLSYFRKLTYIKALFEHKRRIHEYDVTLSVSYMEIYRDEVYDLLVDRETVSHLLAVDSRQYSLIRGLTFHYSLFQQAPKLPVRENDAGQVFVANLSSIPIQDVSEFNKLYSYA